MTAAKSTRNEITGAALHPKCHQRIAGRDLKQPARPPGVPIRRGSRLHGAVVSTRTGDSVLGPQEHREALGIERADEAIHRALAASG
jgi:hypothetical protein